MRSIATRRWSSGSSRSRRRAFCASLFARAGSSWTSRKTPSTPAATPALAPLDAIYPDLDKLYIDLHQTPELSLHEEKTAAKLAARLKALGYEVTQVMNLLVFLNLET